MLLFVWIPYLMCLSGFPTKIGLSYKKPGSQYVCPLTHSNLVPVSLEPSSVWMLISFSMSYPHSIHFSHFKKTVIVRYDTNL